MWNRNFAVLVATLLFIRHLIFDLNGTSTGFDHLLGEKVGCFLITKAGINVGNDGNDVRLEIIDLVDDRPLLNIIVSRPCRIELTEKTAQLARVGLTQERIQLLNQSGY